MADSGGGVVDPYPSASHVFGATEKGIGESEIAPVYPRNGEGVLFSHKFIGVLLAFASEVAIGELIAVEVLMGTTVRSIKDGEGKASEASDVDFIGGKACGGANGVVYSTWGRWTSQSFWCSLQTMANIWAIVWLTRSTPLFPLG